MKTENKKQLVYKLLREEISEEEENQLLNLSLVEKQMFRQWEDVETETATDLSIKHRIWKVINKTIREDRQAKQLHQYKLYSIAATIALLFATGISLFFSTTGKYSQTNYVFTTGIQSIESVILPDGTSVQLGPGSTLEFPAEFIGKERKIKLEGQAFFDITPDKRMPFIVETPAMNVQALGTAFELFCYEEENISEAILLNGKIKISTHGDENKKPIEYYLLPNEKFLLEKNNENVVKTAIDADKYTSWRKGKVLIFENEKLSTIIPRLEQWYGREIIYQKEISETYRFSFKIRDESIEKILFIMGESSPLKFEKTNTGDYLLTLKNNN